MKAELRDTVDEAAKDTELQVCRNCATKNKRIEELEFVFLNDQKRIKELEAQLNTALDHLDKEQELYAELKAQLDKVRGLPEKWRKRNSGNGWVGIKPSSDKKQCANELEQALENDDEN